MNRLNHKLTERTDSARPLAGLRMVCLSMIVTLCLCCVPVAYAQVAASKEEAGELALKQVAGDGKVLSIEEEKPHFKVKVLVDGKVSVVIVIKDPAAVEE